MADYYTSGDIMNLARLLRDGGEVAPSGAPRSTAPSRASVLAPFLRTMDLDRPEVRIDETGHADLPYLPKLRRPGAELRNTNEAVSDWIAQHSDPSVGRAAQDFLNVGKVVMDPNSPLGQINRAAASLTGAPGIAHGALEINRGVQEGSKARVAGGLAETALNAVPATAAIKAARPTLGSVPGIVTTAALGGAATALPSYAEETAMKTPKQQALNALETERKTVQDKIDEITKAAKVPDKTYSRRLSAEQLKAQRGSDLDAYTKQLDLKTAPYREQLTSLDKQIEAARGQTLDEQQNDLPFRQRHPGPTAAIMGTAYGLAGLGPAAAVGANAYKTSQALRAIQAARAAGDESAVRRLQMELANRASPATKAKYAVGGVVGGSGEYTLLSSIPEELDAQIGTPKAQKDASDKLWSWDYWGPRAFMGALGGTGGTAAGFTAAKLGWPHNTATARAEVASPYTPPRPNGGGGGGGGNNGPLVLSDNGWPPAARQAAREYMATTGLADPLAVRPSDVVAAMASRGIIPNPTNVATRLRGTQSYITDPSAPVGSTLTWGDIMNSPKTWKGQKLLSVTPAAALPGLVLDQGPSEGASPQSDTLRKVLRSDTGEPTLAEPLGTDQPHRTAPERSSGLPPGHTLTEWGVRGPDGKFTTKPDADITPNIKARKRERSANTGDREPSLADILRYD